MMDRADRVARSRIWVTTAPKIYDLPDTIEVGKLGTHYLMMRPLRMVAIPPEYEVKQVRRYRRIKNTTSYVRSWRRFKQDEAKGNV